MRRDWCNEHIEETIENCGLSRQQAGELRRAVAFKKEHDGFPSISNDAVMPLLRIKDPVKQAQAIEAVSQAAGPLTKKQVKAIVAQIVPPKEIEAEYDVVEEEKPTSKVCEIVNLDAMYDCTCGIWFQVWGLKHFPISCPNCETEGKIVFHEHRSGCPSCEEIVDTIAPVKFDDIKDRLFTCGACGRAFMMYGELDHMPNTCPYCNGDKVDYQAKPESMCGSYECAALEGIDQLRAYLKIRPNPEILSHVEAIALAIGKISATYEPGKEALKEIEELKQERLPLSKNPEVQAKIKELYAFKMPKLRIAKAVGYPERTVGDFIKKLES